MWENPFYKSLLNSAYFWSRARLAVNKSYKHKELKIVFGKKPIKCKLGDLGEARSMYTQTNVLTDTNCTTAVHRESLAFMVPELMIEEFPIASLNPD